VTAFAEIIGIPWPAAVLCVAVVMFGAAVQATIGLGMALVAAPVLGLVDPAFLPVTTIVLVWPLSVGVVRRERHAVEWRDVGTALIGRVPGVVLGAWVVAVTGPIAIKLVVALSVLLAVVASTTGLTVRTTRRNLLLAGVASGFTGTTAGVGGPPMAIAYQHVHPATTRASLGVFFGLGSVLSFVGLALAGEVHVRQWQLVALLLPGVLLGLGLSRPLISRLPEDRVRIALLGTCAVSATALLVESLVGALG
jgi:uncharacterized membrane protein YfcA